MFGRDCVADAALGVDPQDEGVQELRAAHRPIFSQREQRGGYRHRRMNDGAQVRVVEIEPVGKGPVDARRGQRIETLAAAEQRRLRLARKLAQRSKQALDRFVAAAADRTAEPVEDRALAFVPHGLRNVAPARFHDEVRELSRDVARHCLFPLVHFHRVAGLERFDHRLEGRDGRQHVVGRNRERCVTLDRIRENFQLVA